MNRKVLLVDDEVNVLASHQRVLHKRFDLEVASAGTEALRLMTEKGPYAVLVADMQMPGMNGVELLQQARTRHPGTIRIMLTGNIDQRTAMEAINLGQVYRFLTKPCTPDELALVVETGIRQYQLETAERELLESTLTGALRTLMDILSMADREAFGRSEILRQRAVQVARHLGIRDTWEVGLASMLSQLGVVTLPPDLLVRERAGDALDPKEREALQRIPEYGARLLERIPRLEGVARAVLYQKRNHNGSGFPVEGPAGEDIPLAARILRVLSDFVEIEERRGSRVVALEQLKLRKGWYDPVVLQAVETLFVGPSGRAPGESVARSPEELRIGMVLAEDVTTPLGLVVVPAGTGLQASHLERIRNFAHLIGLREPIRTLPASDQGGGE